MFWSRKHKKQLEVHRFVSRLLSRTDPTLSTSGIDLRQDDRYQRTLSVVVAPYDGGQLAIDKAVRGVTRNLSSNGLSLLLEEPLEAHDVAIGFRVDGDTQIVVGEVRANVAVGGGFWQLGVELSELMDVSGCPAAPYFVSLVEAFFGEPASAAE